MNPGFAGPGSTRYLPTARGGASQLARRCLEIMAEYARGCGAPDVDELKRGLESFATALQKARPSMAPVQNLLDRWLACLPDLPRASLSEAREQAAGSAESLMEQSLRAVRDVSRHAASLVSSGQTILTHSLSSTMVAVFRSVAERGVQAIITESRPLLEGRTLAGHLSKLGVGTGYITDAQVGVFAAQADIAMVGADSILGDGSAVNKAGTYPLALAARDNDLPFYVCCETFKYTSALPGAIELEEMDASELHTVDLPHVTARNVYFDVTPTRLISGWITENGITKTFPQ